MPDSNNSFRRESPSLLNAEAEFLSVVQAAIHPKNVELFRPSNRPPMGYLTVFDDGRTDGEVIRLRSYPFTIGRNTGDFRLPFDPGVGDPHCEITVQPTDGEFRWSLRMLGGLSGFLRVRRTMLKHHDELLVGKSLFRFSTAPDSPAREYEFSHEIITPKLIELRAGEGVREWPLIRATNGIGSAEPIEILCSDDPYMSPKHAVVARDADGRWFAENKKSPNGMWIRVLEYSTKTECVFQIGEQRFRLSTADQVANPAIE